ncbi:MAG: CRISPR-associated endonuclease Cas2 [Candidatus Helarchaeota archaeon]
MLYLVIYDIPQEFNGIRTKISQRCKNHGLERIEYSVFLGDMSQNESETLAMELLDLVEKIPADIRIFPVCKRCFENAIVVKEGGTAIIYKDEESKVVEFS